MSDPFDFDEDIDRREVTTLEAHPTVLGADGPDLFPSGVADMDFRAPSPVFSISMIPLLASGVVEPSLAMPRVPKRITVRLSNWSYPRTVVWRKP